MAKELRPVEELSIWDDAQQMLEKQEEMALKQPGTGMKPRSLIVRFVN